jgi:predicted small secreted protein
MLVSFRIRRVLISVIALLPLVLAACNNGNSSGY